MQSTGVRRSPPLASLPPRPVPWSLHLAALFGGFSNLFGWLFFGFGMIFFWVFGLNSDLSGALFSFTPSETTQGVILSVDGTSSSVNDAPVYRIRFAYTVRGQNLESVGYATGSPPREGTRVSVEALQWDPAVARVSGTRRAVFPASALFVAIFPLVGLAFILSGMSEGYRAARLLRVGRLATGKLIGTEATNASINNRPVMKLTFEFTAHDGSTGLAIAKTHTPRLLEDEAEEQLLYDPADPSTAVMLDSIAGAPRLGPDGGYAPRPWATVLPLLIVPVSSLLGHGGYLVYLLMR